MCGIAGIADFTGKQEPVNDRIRSMVDTLRHRGPDEEGIHVGREVALGMRRLSIIDIEGGSQPIYNEDGSVKVVFNGEIYNYREMRDRLSRKGHMFSTKSDTEVIVHAYEEFGPQFAARLNGMFAIALHDSRRRRLILVRDQLGIKPLYYSLTDEQLVWGSEIKAILASERVDKSLNVDALAEFLTWEYVPAPSTLFESIRKLEPGTMLEVDLRRPSWEITKYWDLEPSADQPSMSGKDWEQLVDEQLKQSTRRQLVSDVPLGAFLSGGVDSSLIVSAMGSAQTFSIGFDDPSYNELNWAQKVADHLDVEHLQETIKPDILELFSRLMHFMDDPIGDFSIFPTYLVSKLAREHVTVVLSGDGGDEIFGGYETYVANNVARLYSHVPAFMRRYLLEPVIDSLKPRSSKKGLVNKSRRFIQGMRHPSELEHARWRIFASENLLSNLLTPAAQSERTKRAAAHVEELFDRAEDFSPVNQLLYVDLKSYLSENILTKVDRMSMAVSLETRVPYLDTEMVELAFRVPDELKVKRNQTKVLLKQLAARYIPRDCVYRPKEGFSIPIKNWLKTQFRPMLEEYLDNDRLSAQGIFRSDTVSRLKNEHLNGTANHSHVLWSLIVFQAWWQNWYE